MARWSLRRRVVSWAALALVAVAALSLRSPSQRVRTGDRDGDGRPDSWRVYDGNGRLSQLAVDSNLDGVADVHEYYDHGTLLRRESDRNFNTRVDLVQEFDPATQELRRSATDVDFDGTADLLELFQDGRLVFSKWWHRVVPVDVSAALAPSVEGARRSADASLTPLDDPFRADLAVTAVRLAPDSADGVGLAASAGMPTDGTSLASPAVSSTHSPRSDSRPSPSTADLHSPRGPPSSSLLS